MDFIHKQAGGQTLMHEINGGHCKLPQLILCSSRLRTRRN
jgi:hypothetical protein